MKIIEKKCPNCGANLDFKVGERDITCKSCRRKFAVQYDGVDFSQLSEQALNALKDADINLQPVRRMIFIIVAIFFVFALTAAICSFISISNSRAKFQKQVEQSQEDFERRSKEMIEEVRR